MDSLHGQNFAILCALTPVVYLATQGVGIFRRLTNPAGWDERADLALLYCLMSAACSLAALWGLAPAACIVRYTANSYRLYGMFLGDDREGADWRPSGATAPSAGHGVYSRWASLPTGAGGILASYVPSEACQRYNMHRGPPAAEGSFMGGECPGASCAEVHPVMDGMHLSFAQYLWCMWFVRPCVQWGSLVGGRNTRGMLGLVWRKVKLAAGLVAPPGDSEVQEAICTFIMETSMVYWVPPDSVDERAGEALCSIPSIVHIVDRDRVDSGDLVIAFNFHARRLVSPPTYRGEEINPRDCLALLFTSFAGHSHPQVHAHANWGADTHSSRAFTRRMAVVTRFYNNMGFDSYPSTMARFESMGLATATTEQNTRYICHPNHNLPLTYKGAIAAGLEPHSGYVRFANEARRLVDPRGASSRGLCTYLTSVVHPIDHNHAPRILNADLFEPSDEAFAADHDWARNTLSCFVDSPPGRSFDVGLERCGVGALELLFRKLNEIDPRFARDMAGGICQ